MFSGLKKLKHLAFSLVFLALTGGVLAWVWVTVESYGVSLIEQVQTIENERAFESQYTELIREVEETKTQRQALNVFVIQDEKDTIAFLSELDEIALKHNVELTTRELSVVEQSGTYNDLVVGFNIGGAEHAVMQMIKIFENLPYHGHITSLSVSRNREDVGGASVDATVSLVLTIAQYD